MQAAVRTRYGPPEVVRIADVPTPDIKADEVLVKVRATTVNRTDCGFRSGKPGIVRLFTGLSKPKTAILGNEFAGEIVAAGNHVTAFEVGDRVFGYNDSTFGAHAEYLAVRQNGLVATMPAGLQFEEVAPSTEGSHYALACIRSARVHRGQAVLVIGATGAIGSAAVQLLANAGVEITAVCDGEQAELVRGLGAGRIIDRESADFTREAERYDVVFDAAGKSSFGRCRHLLKRRGIYLSTDLGPWSQNPLLSVVTALSRGRKARMPIPRNDPHMVSHFKELMESRSFKPVVDRRYPLEHIVEAYRYVETGQKIGNVVITVSPGKNGAG